MKKTRPLEITESVFKALKFPENEIENELLKELGISLYKRGALSLGKARELAHMTKWEFISQLKKRKILRHYGEKELEEDIDYARRDGSE